MEEDNLIENVVEERKYKVALELNEHNIIVGFVYQANEDYTKILEDNPKLIVVECVDIDDIEPYKTKYEDGQFYALGEYTQEYYAQLQINEQLNTLYEWFNEYDMQIKQYERDMRIGCVGTYHIGDTTYSIAELDQEATQKAQQISNLRQQLKNIQ